jgi:hypothetical protein
MGGARNVLECTCRLELELIQTQVTQKPVLQAEVNARALDSEVLRLHFLHLPTEVAHYLALDIFRSRHKILSGSKVV